MTANKHYSKEENEMKKKSNKMQHLILNTCRRKRNTNQNKSFRFFYYFVSINGCLNDSSSFNCLFVVIFIEHKKHNVLKSNSKSKNRSQKKKK